MTASPFQGQNGAVISHDKLFRYALWRGIEGVPAIVWVMLNPSTADHTQDDPTIRKVRGFSERMRSKLVWPGFRIVVVNLYGFRATEPEHLFPPRSTFDGAPLPGWNPVGPQNDEYISLAMDEVRATNGRLMFAWGANKAPKIDERIAVVERLANGLGVEPWCLEGRTKAGRPKHPLMPGYDTMFTPYSESVHA